MEGVTGEGRKKKDVREGGGRKVFEEKEGKKEGRKEWY